MTWAFNHNLHKVHLPFRGPWPRASPRATRSAAATSGPQILYSVSRASSWRRRRCRGNFLVPSTMGDITVSIREYAGDTRGFAEDSQGFAEDSRRIRERIRDGFAKVRDGYANSRIEFARIRESSRGFARIRDQYANSRGFATNTRIRKDSRGFARIIEKLTSKFARIREKFATDTQVRGSSSRAFAAG